MKIKLLGKNLADIRRELPRFGLEEVESGFELVIAHGGDGALLGAEREYPGVPKLPIRDAATAPTCPAHQLTKVLADFVAGKLSLTKLPKLCAECGDRKLLAINDIMLHNAERTSALRYRVSIDGELYAREVVGDGLCFAGVHGSTAYYRCITHGIFRAGVGVAFSNSTEAVDHLVLPESAVVEAEVLRGPAIVVADNSPVHLQLDVGDKVTFHQTAEYAEVYGLSGFMCHECRILRHCHLY